MNIEQFVNNYLQEHRHDVLLNPYNGLVDFAKAFQEELMQDAVEGTVHNFSSYKPHPTVLVDAKGFNQGDKVRVIIIKEDSHE